jgi:hypothetical protein
MKLDKASPLFFGCKIDSKLREGLAQCKPGDRKYFEGESEEFLRVLQFEEERWIGKIVKGGLVVTEVDDIQRNIISILRRIAPGVRHSPSAVKIFVLTGAASPTAVSADDEEDAGDEPVSSGPYIANY